MMLSARLPAPSLLTTALLLAVANALRPIVLQHDGVCINAAYWSVLTERAGPGSNAPTVARFWLNSPENVADPNPDPFSDFSDPVVQLLHTAYVGGISPSMCQHFCERLAGCNMFVYWNFYNIPMDVGYYECDLLPATSVPCASFSIDDNWYSTADLQMFPETFVTTYFLGPVEPLAIGLGTFVPVTTSAPPTPVPPATTAAPPTPIPPTPAPPTPAPPTPVPPTTTAVPPTPIPPTPAPPTPAPPTPAPLTPCTVAVDCAGHATAVSGNRETGCTCTCAAAYGGTSCSVCAPFYSGFPNCAPVPCTVASDCNNHADAAYGLLYTGCTCACSIGFAGPSCGSCAPGYNGFPSCTPTCSVAANCSGNAVTATLATDPLSCVCTCAVGYAGATCGACDTGYVGYPTCAPAACSVANQCSGQATSVSGNVVSGCICTCNAHVGGSACDVCLNGYENYPACTAVPCTVQADCNDHASAVTGTLVSGCSCTCQQGYSGAQCNACAAQFSGYPTCVHDPCTLGYTGTLCDSCVAGFAASGSGSSLTCTPIPCGSSDCNNYASAVSGFVYSGCTCTCLPEYAGSQCGECAAMRTYWPDCIPIPCTTASNCNGNAAAVVGNLIDGCVCTCEANFASADCSQCAPNYQGYPTCSPVPCTTSENCDNHASAVSGDVVSGCACSCLAGYTGANCNSCAAAYTGYPACVPAACTIAASCNGHATAVTGDMVNGCQCDCAAGYVGSSCQTCAPHFAANGNGECAWIPCTVAADCSGHADSVTGDAAFECQCQCSQGFQGVVCNQCAPSYAGYPTCAPIPCTIAGDCNGLATSVSGDQLVGCVCACPAGFSGSRCDVCAPNYQGWPGCAPVPCSNDDCNNHATSIAGNHVTGCICNCAAAYDGPTCGQCSANYALYPSTTTCVPIPCTAAANCNGHANTAAGTLVSGCVCSCSTGYTGAACDQCAPNYATYPSCTPIPCSVAVNCNGHATGASGDLISGCSCSCQQGYTGPSCGACANNFAGYPACQPQPCTIADCNEHATAVSGDLVAGCSCQCALGYQGAACDACAENYVGYPTCVPAPCTTADNCNNHASSVVGDVVNGCSCTCAEAYTGTTCAQCSTGRSAYPSCDPIPCTAANDCNSHAISVAGDQVTGCTCTCAVGYSGASCDACAPNYSRDQAGDCVETACTNLDCSGHASSVTGTLVSGCQCTCAVGYSGAVCSACLPSYEGYPQCSETACTVSNCNEHASAVAGTLVSGCQCTCNLGYASSDCSSCANGYTGYPDCAPVACSVAANCNGNAQSVSGNIIAGCVCTCSTGFAGTSCERCDTNYQGFPQCEPTACSNSDCSGHATAVAGTLVSGCQCTCEVGYHGDHCDACAQHYTGYPTCVPAACALEDACNDHAVDVSGDQVSGCSCECLEGFDGATCDRCSLNYDNYPTCAPTACDVDVDCNGHASAVSGTLISGCACTCATGYQGSTCNSCATHYTGYPNCAPEQCTVSEDCNGHATSVTGTRVSGCRCNCSVGFDGPSCFRCAAPYTGYPACVPRPCTIEVSCNGHASAVSGTLISGCSCTCLPQFVGSTCNSCAPNYEAYPNCSEAACTNAGNCNGNAISVEGTLAHGCVCQCAPAFTGASCSQCAPQYQGYPTCQAVPCTNAANCNGNAETVFGTLVSGCVCNCAAGFSGAQCNACAANHQGYPTCAPTTCQNALNCNGHATSVSGDLITGCQCVCAPQYSGPTCGNCAPGYAHPSPSASECTLIDTCTNAKDCNGHAVDVWGNEIVGCSCVCATGYYGAACDQCAPSYENYPSCRPACGCTGCPSTSNCVGGCCNATGTCRIDTCAGNQFGSQVVTCPMVTAGDNTKWNWCSGHGNDDARAFAAQATTVSAGLCTNGVCPQGFSCSSNQLGTYYTTCQYGSCSGVVCQVYDTDCAAFCLGRTVGGANNGKVCVTNNWWRFNNPSSTSTTIFKTCGLTAPDATAAPTAAPTSAPTAAPTAAPTTRAPTAAPTAAPTSAPTAAPTAAPTTRAPTAAPTTRAPTAAPTAAPTSAPTAAPTSAPTAAPTAAPTTRAPTAAPTAAPTTASPVTASPQSKWWWKTPAPVSVNPACGTSAGSVTAVCVRVGSKSSCRTHCLGYVQCTDPTNAACAAIAGKTCIRHEAARTFSVCEGLPATLPPPTRYPVTSAPTVAPTTTLATTTLASTTTPSTLAQTTAPTTTKVPPTSAPPTTTTAPTTRAPTTKKPTTSAPPTPVPATPTPTRKVHNCKMAFSCSVDDFRQNQGAFVSCLARVFRCPQNNVRVRSCRGGSIIVDADIVDSPLDDSQAVAALQAEATNTTSELVATLGVVPDSIAVTTTTVEDNGGSSSSSEETIFIEPTTQAPINGKGAGLLPGGSAMSTGTTIAIAVGCAVAVVAIGVVAGVLLVRSLRKSASQPKKLDHSVLGASTMSSSTLSPPFGDSGREDPDPKCEEGFFANEPNRSPALTAIQMISQRQPENPLEVFYDEE